MSHADHKKRIFYLDTNIVLDDPEVHLKLGPENEVRLPWTVFEELDRIKGRGNEASGDARRFSRNIMRLAEGRSLREGIPLPTGGFLKVVTAGGEEVPDMVPKTMSLGGRDVEILRAVLIGMKEEGEKRDCILVTNDVNLSLAANVVGIRYEDRLADRVDIGEHFYRGYALLDFDKGVLGAAAQQVYSAFVSGERGKSRHLPLSEIGRHLTAAHSKALRAEIASLAHNKFWVFVDDKNRPCLDSPGRPFDTEMIIRYDHKEQAFFPLRLRPHEKVLNFEALNLEQQLAFELGVYQSERTSQFAIVGEAGTGKTFTWLLMALYNVMRARERLDNGNPEAKVYVSKPRQSLDREEYGFEPGDLNEKLINDYRGMQANYQKIIKGAKLGDTFESNFQKAIADTFGLIEIRPVGFIQGSTFEPDDWVLIDEAQNTSLKTMMTLATRGGHFAAMGNIYRPDNPHVRPDANGLVHAVEAVQRAKELGSLYFLQAALVYSHPVRHESVKYVLDCFPSQGRRREE